MNIKYRVTLTAEERNRLMRIISKGKTEGYRIRHAHILLATDEIEETRSVMAERSEGVPYYREENRKPMSQVSGVRVVSGVEV